MTKHLYSRSITEAYLKLIAFKTEDFEVTVINFEVFYLGYSFSCLGNQIKGVEKTFKFIKK